MLCILYVTGVGILLATIGALAEPLLASGVGRRWIWCLTIPASVVLPAYYRFHHSLAVIGGRPGTMLGWADAAVLRQLDATGSSISQAGLAASALLALWAMANTAYLARLMRAPGNRQRRTSTSVVDGVPVVITDQLGPATVGVWRARVVLPRWVLALPHAQRAYVLQHEEEHRRAHDCAMLFAAWACAIVLPWNLALWWQLRRLSLAVEMDCDTRVVSSLGDADAYGRLLLAVAENASHGLRLQPAFLGGAGMLERRLETFLAPKPLRAAQRILLPLLVAALLVLVLAMPHPMLAAHAHGHGAAASAMPK